MDQAIFTTERLVLRPLATARPALETALPGLLTPGVLAPLPPSLAFSPGQDAAAWVDARAAESDLLVVEDRDTGAVIGMVILAPGTRDRVHLGYLLAETAWGRGLASEMLAGLVTWVDRTTPAVLLGGVARDNPASARVLEKAGFRAEKTEGEMVTYRRDAPGSAP